MKRLIGIILGICAALGCCCIAVSAYAQEDVSASLTIEVTEDGAVITGCDKSFTGDMIIPDSYNSTPVVGIAARAFSDCIGIESVIIPNTVISVGEYAFSGCSALKTVDTGDGVSIIGEGAFAYCTSLEKVAISDYVETLEYFTFAECASLDQIVLGRGVKSVSDGAFYGVEGLRFVFYRGSWDGFDEIDVGSSYNIAFITATVYYEIDEDALIEDGIYTYSIDSRGANIYVCDRVAAGVIEVPSTLGGYEVAVISRGAFRDCTGITRVTLPDTITTIAVDSFNGCSSLEEINIPKNAVSIATGVFRNCASLQDINVSEDNPSFTSVDGVMYNKEKTTLYTYPAGRVGPYTIPEGATYITTNAFIDAKGLSGVIFPDGIEEIDSNAFYGCSSLAYVYIPNTVEYISNRAFSDVNPVIYYSGTEEEWNAVIGAEDLTDMTVNFGAAPPSELPFSFSNAAFGYGEFWNTCRFTATLNKNYDSDAEPIVIVGVYDEMDDLMDLYTQEVSIDEVGGSVEIDCEFNVNGYYCRVFVWDAATNAPLGYDVKVNKI